MSSRQKSRQCPYCTSNDTEQKGEFGLCLKCSEVFDHVNELVDLEAQRSDRVGGTHNG